MIRPKKNPSLEELPYKQITKNHEKCYVEGISYRTLIEQQTEQVYANIRESHRAKAVSKLEDDCFFQEVKAFQVQ